MKKILMLALIANLFLCNCNPVKEKTSAIENEINVSELTLKQTAEMRILNPQVKLYLDRFLDKYTNDSALFEIWVSDISENCIAIVFKTGYHKYVFTPSHYINYRKKKILIYSNLDLIFRKAQKLDKHFKNNDGNIKRDWCIVFCSHFDKDSNWTDNIVYFDSTSRIPYDEIRKLAEVEDEQ